MAKSIQIMTPHYKYNALWILIVRLCVPRGEIPDFYALVGGIWVFWANWNVMFQWLAEMYASLSSAINCMVLLQINAWEK